MQVKKVQRQQLLQTRNQLPAWFQQKCSLAICNEIRRLDCYQAASHLALYRATHREVSLDLLWQYAWEDGKTCYFPVMQPKHQLGFVKVNSTTVFHKNRFAILEPDGAPSTSKIDLFFLPLLGFDEAGNRLGMGGGYYDRTLAYLKKPYCVGVGYAFQQLKKIVHTPTDIPLNLIVTEQGVLYPKTRSSK